jgi:multimeric flavodoxin WrbA
MKVVAVNGSPRKDGNTHQALTMVGEVLLAEGIDFEILHVGHKLIHGCMACGKCAVSKDGECSIKTDDLNKWIQQLKDADGIIIGSPVYYSGISGTMKCFLDRAFYVAGVNGGLFRHKVGASVVALRRSGGSATFDSMNHYLTNSEMIVATANYWNIIHGREIGEVTQDVEGRQIMRVLGKNMTWILKMKEASKGLVEEPLAEKKEAMHFIR